MQLHLNRTCQLRPPVAAEKLAYKTLPLLSRLSPDLNHNHAHLHHTVQPPNPDTDH